MIINDGDFTGKAELYSKYRHSYPKEIIKLLNEKYRFTRDMVVGDIGCGTGALATLFLENGNMCRTKRRYAVYVHKDIIKI